MSTLIALLRAAEAEKRGEGVVSAVVSFDERWGVLAASRDPTAEERHAGDAEYDPRGRKAGAAWVPPVTLPAAGFTPPLDLDDLSRRVALERGLTPEQRVLAELRGAGFTQAEIAAHRGVSPSSVGRDLRLLRETSTWLADRDGGRAPRPRPPVRHRRPLPGSPATFTRDVASVYGRGPAPRRREAADARRR